MSRENNNNNSDYLYPYPLSKLNTSFLPQDPNFYFQNQNKNINNKKFTDASRFFSSITNDDTSSSCCSISELTTSDQQCIGVEDHVGDDFISDPEIRSPDSPSTPTAPFGGVNVNISYPWSTTTTTSSSVYEIPPITTSSQKFFHTQTNFPLLNNLNTQQNVQQHQHHQQQQQQKNESSPEIISPPQSSPSLSTSSCLDYIGDNVNVNNLTTKDDDIPSYHDDNNNEAVKKLYHKKSKEDIFLKFKLPVNGIATRTRSKKTISSSDPPSSKKKHHHRHLTEEEKVIQKYSSKVADIPPFSRKVTIPSMNPKVVNVPKNPNYPIPKSRQQILSNWTYQDQKRFLATYLSEGKNFGQLAKSLNKTTKEVVEFYYYFKMSPKFRTAKVIKKDIISYASKLEQISDSISKLKHLSSSSSSSSSTISSSARKNSPSPMRVTFAPSVISRKRRGRPKKSSHVRGGIYYY